MEVQSANKKQEWIQVPSGYENDWVFRVLLGQLQA
jgi:hypothetical protein